MFFFLTHPFVFLCSWMVRNEFLKGFFFRFMTRKKIPIVFLVCEMVRKEIPSIFIFRKMFRTKLRSSTCFSLLGNDSERNFELFFIFREIAHNWIPSVFRSAKHAEFLSTEWIKTSVCSVFYVSLKYSSYLPINLLTACMRFVFFKLHAEN
jgi:hypothetical protein